MILTEDLVATHETRQDAESKKEETNPRRNAAVTVQLGFGFWVLGLGFRV